MYALDNDSGVQTMPEVRAKQFNRNEPRWFTEGGNGIAPSYPGADWFNIVQAELLNILTEANIAPDKSQLNQITLAIKEVVKNSVSKSVEGKANKTHKHPVSDITGLQDAIDEAGKKGLPLGAILAFSKEITNPVGFLKCDGSTFSSETYPDLYQILGNKNKLPNLNSSDVGMLAYFPQNEVPVGWLACDGSMISASEYPELHRYLNNKYGENKLPDAEDRFIRNAGNSLQIGEKQDDEIKKHSHYVPHYYTVGNSSALEREGYDTSNIIRKNDLEYVISADGSLRDNGYIKPLLSNPMAEGGNENRPKSIVFKLCIKAKNQFDDVAFWIKAFGEVTNSGELDASRLAQDIQAVRSEKSDLHHTHRTRDIIDFNDDVSSIIHNLFTQDFSENGWVKLPNGLIFQWGKVKKGYDYVSEEQRVISFPIVFPHKCIHVSLTEFSSSWSYQTTIESRRDLTRAGVKIVSQRNDTTFFAVGY